ENDDRRTRRGAQTRDHPCQQDGTLPDPARAVKNGQRCGVEVGHDNPLVAVAAEKVVALSFGVGLEPDVRAKIVRPGHVHLPRRSRSLPANSSSARSKIVTLRLSHNFRSNSDGWRWIAHEGNGSSSSPPAARLDRYLLRFFKTTRRFQSRRL